MFFRKLAYVCALQCGFVGAVCMADEFNELVNLPEDAMELDVSGAANPQHIAYLLDEGVITRAEAERLNAEAEDESETASSDAEEDEDVEFLGTGRVSWFGGPEDDGVDYNSLTAITREKTGELDPDSHYIAMRWDYDDHPPRVLRNCMVRVVASNGRSVLAKPVCWGPARWTGRIADVSPGVMESLGVKTDDTVRTYLVPKD